MSLNAAARSVSNTWRAQQFWNFAQVLFVGPTKAFLSPAETAYVSAENVATCKSLARI